MSVNEQASSGAVATSGGVVDVNAVSNDQSSTSGGDKSSEGHYPAHFVDKLKREKENTAKKVHELQSQLDALKSQQVQAEKDELQKKEQYKTLWEQTEQKAQSLAQKLQEKELREVEAKKRNAIKQQLLKLGLNAQHEETAFRLMNSSTVIIDDETGSVIGAEDAAKSFYDQYKTLGIFGKTGPGVSHTAPSMVNSSSKDLSQMNLEELKEAYRKVSLT
jgi:hypothetical protein